VRKISIETLYAIAKVWHYGSWLDKMMILELKLLK
jgi:hypothetical protein